MGSEIATTKIEPRYKLWYHDPAEEDYSINGYILIGDINNVQQFWSIVDGISKEKWEAGYFFFMKKGYPPIYEAPENINGGSWSKTINRENAYNTFIHLMVNCLSNELLVERKETLVGVTLSNKDDVRDSVIRIYNTTYRVKDSAYLKKNIPNFQIGKDVVYKKNIDRNISFNNNSSSSTNRRPNYNSKNSKKSYEERR